MKWLKRIFNPLMVFIGDWLDGDAWNEDEVLDPLFPVRVLGSNHRKCILNRLALVKSLLLFACLQS